MKGHFTTKLIVTLSIIILINGQCKNINEINVSNTDQLVETVKNSPPGSMINLAAGEYVFKKQLELKSGMVLKGAGIGQTIIFADENWQPGLEGLPANEKDVEKVNREPYLFELDSVSNIVISDMTITAPNLHGAIFGNKCNNLHFFNIKFVDFRWSAIYTFDINKFIVNDCIFEDAGGKVKWLGAGIFNNRTIHGDFYNCKIYSTPERKNNFVGFKGMGNDSSRIHHNTVETGGYGWGFCLEYMHSDNSHIEIDHNKFNERISIPCGGGGGTVNKGDYSFWIHHNWLSGKSEIIEGPRGYLIFDHNLVDMNTEVDGGNLYTDHDKREVLGPLLFHNNLIRNPGRGIFWSVSKYNKYSFHNNHVIANTTITPRKEGFFDFNVNSVFDSVSIKNNIIECNGLARPLFRNDASGDAVVDNNLLTNVSDGNRYTNPQTGNKQGIVEELHFECGYRKEFTIKGWTAYKNNLMVTSNEIITNDD